MFDRGELCEIDELAYELSYACTLYKRAGAVRHALSMATLVRLPRCS